MVSKAVKVEAGVCGALHHTYEGGTRGQRRGQSPLRRTGLQFSDWATDSWCGK